MMHGGGYTTRKSSNTAIAPMTTATNAGNPKLTKAQTTVQLNNSNNNNAQRLNRKPSHTSSVAPGPASPSPLQLQIASSNNDAPRSPTHHPISPLNTDLASDAGSPPISPVSAWLSQSLGQDGLKQRGGLATISQNQPLLSMQTPQMSPMSRTQQSANFAMQLQDQSINPLTVRRHLESSATRDGLQHQHQYDKDEGSQALTDSQQRLRRSDSPRPADEQSPIAIASPAQLPVEFDRRRRLSNIASQHDLEASQQTTIDSHTATPRH
jgi:hypothetical protein